MPPPALPLLALLPRDRIATLLVRASVRPSVRLPVSGSQ
jgi:hypothetical protein